jgi:polyphosphate kinase
MSERLLNRELSWLDFNRRVLALAHETGIPPLERVKFVAICSSNLDEFFQVRISALKDQVAAGVTSSFTGGLTPTQQLAAIAPNVEAFVIEQEKVLLDVLVPELAERGVRLVSWEDLGDDDKSYPIDIFDQRIFPVLTPLAVDPAHPFPYISNLALSLAAMVSDPDTGERRFARVKIPTVFPRLVGLPDGVRFLPAEQLIAAQLPACSSAWWSRSTVLRVTRNVDLTLEDEEADDLLPRSRWSCAAAASAARASRCRLGSVRRCSSCCCANSISGPTTSRSIAHRSTSPVCGNSTLSTARTSRTSRGRRSLQEGSPPRRRRIAASSLSSANGR